MEFTFTEPSLPAAITRNSMRLRSTLPTTHKNLGHFLCHLGSLHNPPRHASTCISGQWRHHTYGTDYMEEIQKMNSDNA